MEVVTGFRNRLQPRTLAHTEGVVKNFLTSARPFQQWTHLLPEKCSPFPFSVGSFHFQYSCPSFARTGFKPHFSLFEINALAGQIGDFDVACRHNLHGGPRGTSLPASPTSRMETKGGRLFLGLGALHEVLKCGKQKSLRIMCA